MIASFRMFRNSLSIREGKEIKMRTKNIILIGYMRSRHAENGVRGRNLLFSRAGVGFGTTFPQTAVRHVPCFNPCHKPRERLETQWKFPEMKK